MFKACLAGLLGVSIGSGALSSTTSVAPTLSPPPLDDYLRWGPLRVRPGLQLRDFGYDNNVLNAPTERAESDFRLTLAPRADGLVLFGDRAFLTFDEEVRYTAYVKNTDLNYFDTLGEARLTVPFGNIGVFTDLSYDRVRQSPVDLDDIRPVQRFFEIGFGGIAEIGWRTTIEVRHAQGDWRNFDDDFGREDLSIGDLLDRGEDRDGLTVRYRAFGRTELTAEVERIVTTFDTPNIEEAPGFDRDADTDRWLVGATMKEGQFLTGRVRFGRTRLDHDGAAIRDFSGWIGDLDVRWRTGVGTRIRIDGERDVGFSVWEGNEYYVYDQVRLGAVHYVTRFLGLEAEVSRGELEVPGVGRSDTIDRGKIGVRLRLAETDLGRRIEYSVAFGRFRRDSSRDEFDRDRNTFGVNVILGY